MELKVAVVTGASSGIGYAISKMLSEEGYKVYGIGRIFKGDVSFFEERISMDIRDLVVAAVWFTIWYNKQERNQQ